MWVPAVCIGASRRPSTTTTASSGRCTVSKPANVILFVKLIPGVRRDIQRVLASPSPRPGCVKALQLWRFAVFLSRNDLSFSLSYGSQMKSA